MTAILPPGPARPASRLPPLVDGFVWTVGPIGPFLQSAALADVADHVFTTRTLRLRGAREREDWAAVAATMGVAPARLLRPRQVHGRNVLVHRRGEPVPRWCGTAPAADVIATDDAEVAVSVQVADCIPMLLADPVTGAVAAAHAGWRGSAAGVAAAAVGALVESFGATPSDLVVALGPSIGPCCYEVGRELHAVFLDAGFARAEVERWFTPAGPGPRTAGKGARPPTPRAGMSRGRRHDERPRLDLWTANRDQLMAAGVPAEQIHLSRLCTVDHCDTFFSYRADGPGTGRTVGAIRGRGLGSLARQHRDHRRRSH